MMYTYVYDIFLKDKKYRKPLIRIENKLTDLGLNGKIRRLSILNSLEGVVKEELRHQVHTLVVVGGDEIITKVIDLIVGSDVLLGIIPLGPNQSISTNLGIPHGEEACITLSRRCIRNIQLGLINQNYFIQNVNIVNQPVSVECDGKYHIHIGQEHALAIHNPLFGKEFKKNSSFRAVIHQIPKKSFFSRSVSKTPLSSIPCKRLIVLQKKNVMIRADGVKVVKTPAVIERANETLQIITGKLPQP